MNILGSPQHEISLVSLRSERRHFVNILGSIQHEIITSKGLGRARKADGNRRQVVSDVLQVSFTLTKQGRRPEGICPSVLFSTIHKPFALQNILIKSFKPLGSSTVIL